MTAPNIAQFTTITGKSAYGNLATSGAYLVNNNTGSSTVVKLNTIIVSNFSTSTIVANVYVARNGYNYSLASNMSVPGSSSLTILGKDTPVYLEEGDSLGHSGNTSSVAVTTVSYEIVS
jgi:hypothetical protein